MCCLAAVTEHLPQLKIQSTLIISPFFLSLPVVAVSVVKDDNYTPLSNSMPPHSLILSLSPPSKNLSSPLRACVSPLSQGESPTNANNTLTDAALPLRKLSIVVPTI